MHECHCGIGPTNGWDVTLSRRYTSRVSSAVSDGVRKHTPCPLMTTTGMQRKPGVQVRLAAGSPKASRHSHLNPGFKVVWHASSWRRMPFSRRARRRALTARKPARDDGLFHCCRMPARMKLIARDCVANCADATRDSRQPQRIAAAQSLAQQLLSLPSAPAVGPCRRLLGDGRRDRAACLATAIAAGT